MDEHLYDEFRRMLVAPALPRNATYLMVNVTYLIDAVCTGTYLYSEFLTYQIVYKPEMITICLIT
jgi:hypothetical protein